MAFIEIDLVSEEEFHTASTDEKPPEEFEAMDDLDHLYMDEQLYLQSVLDL
jgi:hypothetical protein